MNNLCRGRRTQHTESVTHIRSNSFSILDDPHYKRISKTVGNRPTSFLTTNTYPPIVGNDALVVPRSEGTLNTTEGSKKQRRNVKCKTL